MFHWRLLHGLYLKVLIGLVTVILLVLTGSTLVSVRSSQAHLMDELIEQGSSQAEILAYSASEYLAQQNQLQLTLIAKNAVARRNVQYIAFYSKAGDLLASATAEGAPSSASAAFANLPQQSGADEPVRWSDDYLEITQPVLYAQRSIGTVALRIGTQELAVDEARTVRQGIFTALILALIFSGALGILLRYLVIAPLRQLSTTAEAISAGSWIAPPGRERHDELGQVARSFGQMVDTLQTRESELQDQIAAVNRLNAELDMRVAQRTADLYELVNKQEHLLDQIHQMSIPVVPVLEGVIVVPIIGSLDSQRTKQLIKSVLGGIEEHHVTCGSRYHRCARGRYARGGEPSADCRCGAAPGCTGIVGWHPP